MLFELEVASLGMTMGLILGLTGAGGAILSVPLLTLVLHLQMNQAGPIGLLALTAGASISVALGLRDGIVRYKAAGLMASIGLLLSPIGLILAQKLPNTPLVLLFAALLLWVALRMWKNAGSQKMLVATKSETHHHTFRCLQSGATGKIIWTLPCARALALTGALAGFLSGLIGVGGGFIIVPSLKSNTNLDMRSIVATSLAVIALVSAGGVVVATSQGAINWAIGIPFSMGTIAGMLAGRSFSKHISHAMLSRGFAGLAIFAALMMVAKVWL